MKQNTVNMGLFITFEGGDGAGKSTQIKKLKKYLEEIGHKVLIIREPGGTEIGEKIRNILLDPQHTEMTTQAELLLFEASRAQIVEEKIRPALEKGTIVLADRFFDSSVAYQGYARDLSVESIKTLNLFATNGLIPNKTIVIVPKDINKALKKAQEKGADRLESAGEAFHEKVKEGFLDMARKEPERFIIIQQQEQKDDTFALILSALKDSFKDQFVI